jgi:hypothetical protein
MAGILAAAGLGWEGFPASLPSALGQTALTAASRVVIYGGALLVLWRLAGRPEGAETEILGGAQRFLRTRSVG